MGARHLFVEILLMLRSLLCLRSSRRRLAALRAVACLALAVSQLAISIPLARADGPSAPAATTPDAKAPDKAAEKFDFATKDIGKNAAPADAKPAADAVAVIPPMNPLDMYRKGGFLMYPITFMSFVVVAFTIEPRWACGAAACFPASW